MKIGIMQPYFFPYIGYWQLINAVDKFVIFDDVNFIKKGWINRNNILLNGNAHLFTLPLCKASQNKLINEICVNNDEVMKLNLLKTMELCYRKAPYFQDVIKILEDIILYPENNLSLFLKYQIATVCDYLNIQTEIITSSSLDNNKSLHAQDKIIDICKLEGANHYINPIGGVDLYDRAVFENNNIKLNFINSCDISYQQFNDNFVPNLSIIDVMMFNKLEDIQKFLDKYELI